MRCLIPTLKAAKLSRGRGDITEADEEYVLRSIREIVEDLGDEPKVAAADSETEAATRHRRRRRPRTPLDARSSVARPTTRPIKPRSKCSENLLDPDRWKLDLIAPETLTAELLDLVAEKRPALFASRRPRRVGWPTPATCASGCGLGFPDLKILVCRWGPRGRLADRDPGQLLEAGADSITTTLLETRQQLTSLLARSDSKSEREQASARHAPAGRSRTGSAQAGRAGQAVPRLTGCGCHGLIVVS